MPRIKLSTLKAISEIIKGFTISQRKWDEDDETLLAEDLAYLFEESKINRSRKDNMSDGSHSHWEKYLRRIIKKGKKEFIQFICEYDGVIFWEVKIKKEATK